jgi:hypothetical protein
MDETVLLFSASSTFPLFARSSRYLPRQQREKRYLLLRYFPFYHKTTTRTLLSCEYVILALLTFLSPTDLSCDRRKPARRSKVALDEDVDASTAKRRRSVGGRFGLSGGR